MTITITTDNLSGALYPLYCRYPGQTAPQPAYVELDTETGELSADYDGEIGPAVPAAVYEGRVRRYQVPKPDAWRLADIESLLAEIAPLAERVIDAGTEDLHKIECEIEAMIEDMQPRRGDIVGVWQAADWLDGVDVAQEYGIGSHTTEAELEAIAAQIEAETEADGVQLEGVLEYLEGCLIGNDE